MKLVCWQIVIFSFVFISCGSHGLDTKFVPHNKDVTKLDTDMHYFGKWLALGDSDFDSYQSNDFDNRVVQMAANSSCVLSPIEVQARDGRDFGQFKKWEDDRRTDYRLNFSLSGTSVRSSLFDWRAKFKEDMVEGIKELVRELLNMLPGYKPAMSTLMLAELQSLSNDPELNTEPVIVQINLGINDINGYASQYNEFTSMKSHFSWVDIRTDAIKNIVDKMREEYPNIVIVLWQLLDDSVVDKGFTVEQERRIISHTDYWNSNLKEIADSRDSVVVFEVKTLVERWIGRKSNETDRDIIIDGINYYRDNVPSQFVDNINNTQYIMTRDGHGNTVLSALFTRELYRLINDKFGAGLSPFSPVKINSITCQKVKLTDKNPSLSIPDDVIVSLSSLPYSIGLIEAFDANGKDVSASAVAVSDSDGVLYGDGHNLQLRYPRHGKGIHQITIKVSDANGRVASKFLKVTIN